MSITIKRNDLRPTIDAIIEAPAGTAVDLTGATVKFIMALTVGATPKINTAATVLDAEAGSVRYTWTGTDTDTVGLYRAEFEVTFASGAKRTFPVSDYLYVNIEADLA